MSLASEQVLMRVYLQSADRAPHTPTYERITRHARNEGLAGATVLKGIMGFGSHGLLKPARWGLVEHVPVIVEIVDSAERLERFINQTLDRVMVNGMLTLERANVMMYRHGGPGQPSPLTLGAPREPLLNLPKLHARSHMTINEDGILLRVFAGESDTYQHKRLYEAIVQKTRELGLAGATVLRGVEGFGANSVVHKAKVLDLSTDLPIVIEIVDTAEKIRQLLPHLEQMVQEGMITMEYVAIVLYRHNPADAPPSTSAPG